MAKRNEAAENRPAVRPVRLTSDMSMPKLSAVEIGSYIAAFAGLFFCGVFGENQTRVFTSAAS